MKTRIAMSDRAMYYGEKYIESNTSYGIGYWQSVTKEYMFKPSATIALWLYKRRRLK